MKRIHCDEYISTNIRNNLKRLWPNEFSKIDLCINLVNSFFSEIPLCTYIIEIQNFNFVMFISFRVTIKKKNQKYF